MKNKDKIHKIHNEDHIIKEDLKFIFVVNVLVLVKLLHIEWI